MKFSGIATLATLATSVAASGKWAPWEGKKCMTDADLATVIANSITFLEHKDIAVANATAQATFAPEIQELGDSINSLRGDPLGTVVSSNSTQYIGDELSAPGIPDIMTVDSFHTCDRFLWYWQFNGLGSGQYRVRGVTIGTYDADSGLVTKQVVEFNSIAWGLDTGYTIIPPANYPKRSLEFKA